MLLCYWYSHLEIGTFSDCGEDDGKNADDSDDGDGNDGNDTSDNEKEEASDPCTKPVIENSSVEPTTASVESGTSYTVTCNPGHQLAKVGTDVMQCTDGGLDQTASCNACSEGTYTAEGETRCSSCPDGSSSTAAATFCSEGYLIFYDEIHKPVIVLIAFPSLEL